MLLVNKRAQLPEKDDDSNQWRSRKVSALLVRVLAFAVPLLAGYLAGRVVAGLMEPPVTVPGVVAWWVVVIATAGLAAHVAERFTRKLAPLSALLHMTLAFPDKAPSRFRIALRAGNISELKNRLAHATSRGDDDLANAAELILSLSAALSKHDRRTRGHSERTRAYTDLLAEELGLSLPDRDKLRWAALLHDVGKLEVPAEILNKPGRLDDDEWHIVSQHPIEGMRLIAPIAGWLGHWATTIEHHHERWNGSGYPHGLAGEEIALGARVVAVADAYDVMVTGRTYQSKMSHQKAREEVAFNAGTQFDPRVARALMSIALGRLRWTTGPLAALADLPLLRPIAALGRDVAMVVTAGVLTVSAGVGGVFPIPDLSPSGQVAVAANSTDSQQGGGNGNGSPVAAGTTSGGQGTSSTIASSASTPTSTTGTNLTMPTSTTQPAVTTTNTTIPPTTTTTPATTTTIPPTTTTSAGTTVANDDQAATRPSDKVNINVLANDTGSVLASTLTIVQPPSVGTATITGGGKVRYSAPSDAAGIVTFTYRVCNAGGSCDTATVSVTVA
jgi:putative nucleotidyltransferase with HDIG domain